MLYYSPTPNTEHGEALADPCPTIQRQNNYSGYSINQSPQHQPTSSKDFGINFTQLGTLMRLYQAPEYYSHSPEESSANAAAKKSRRIRFTTNGCGRHTHGESAAASSPLWPGVFCGNEAPASSAQCSSPAMHGLVHRARDSTSMAVFVSSGRLDSRRLGRLSAVAATYSWQSSYFVVSILSIASLIFFTYFINHWTLGRRRVAVHSD
jgi:hypothetical protein